MNEIVDDDNDKEWIRLANNNVIRINQKLIILQNLPLNDVIINYAQTILKYQFPSLNGFFSTLMLPTLKPLGQWQADFLQICHCRGNHWVMISTKGCKTGEFLAYDSLYDDIDATTLTTFQKIFNCPLAYKMATVQKQKGAVDCGVLSIAVATYIALVNFPSVSFPKFDQEKLRTHLVSCLEAKQFSMFPSTYM